jgi:hypothetical protein
MPWQAGRMGIRIVALALVAILASGCTDDEAPEGSSTGAVTDADCARIIPESVITGLGWTPHASPESTIRGCHREGEQGYVEVREQPHASYAKQCKTLDNTGGLAPGTPVDWLGADVTACAVEPSAGTGSTKVVVKREKGTTLVTVAALVPTDQALVREAVESLL